MLNGLDLFSGIGGITIALSEWVRPVAYCENDRFPQAVLLSLMEKGEIPIAPIWDDVTTLKGSMLPKIDIIYGGFPCQDISIAGAGAGLAGERSGLVKEIYRLTSDVKPRFVFLENVPAITIRGGSEVAREFTTMGYDCRWCVVSAAQFGALHKRERWFLLAYTRRKHKGRDGLQPKGKITISKNPSKLCQNISDTQGIGCKRQRANREQKPQAHDEKRLPLCRSEGSKWWSIEPDMGRVVNGLPNRSHRIKALGNAVVPLQAREAFKILIGLKDYENEAS